MTDRENIQEAERTADEILDLIRGMNCASGLLAVLIAIHEMLHELMDRNPPPALRAQYDNLHTLVVEWIDSRYKLAEETSQQPGQISRRVH